MKNLNIQALRGIAIISVAMYHFTFRWKDLYFYGSKTGSGFYEIGALGVYLFFSISGFVICSSIHTSKRITEFFLKRVIRLIPVLFIVSPGLYLYQKFLPVDYFPKLNFTDVFTSIFILNPTYINYLFDKKIHFVTGVMWTLTYELTFYFLFGLIYFFISKKYFFEIFSFFAILCLFINYIYLFSSFGFHKNDNLTRNSVPDLEFTLRQSGLFSLSWFLVGVWFNRNRVINSVYIDNLLGFTLILLASWDGIGGSSAFVNLDKLFYKILYIFMIFLLIYQSSRKKNILIISKVQVLFAKLGNISYEFYLIHEVIGVTFLYFISKQFPQLKESNYISLYFAISNLFTVLFLSLISFFLLKITNLLFTKHLNKRLLMSLK